MKKKGDKGKKPDFFKMRPQFPKKAVITAGMPYGNKNLHFGHIGGVFVHADIYGRFLRDRIGKDNVIFVSGTDCYGSPIVATYNQLVKEGKFEGTVEDFVQKNHEDQKKALDSYSIDIDLFATSGLHRTGEVHKEICNDFIKKLHKNGYLQKRSTLQFYDTEENLYLNGRQVVGKCPVPGCQSERGYADECSLGHPYEPKELIDPKSVLSGKKPEMREVINWYIDLADFRTELIKWVDEISKIKGSRKYVISIIKEFLEPPVIYIKTEYLEEIKPLLDKIPTHELIESDKTVILKFKNLDERERADQILIKNGIRFRDGKTLTPFRLTGNVEWGLPVDNIDNLDGLTFWVWPESLIAPISFTAAYLEKQGKDKDSWKEWWCSEDSQVYQFIGEDNVYFYTLAELSMFMGADQNLKAPYIISNKHILYMDKKASSSGKIKPPMAHELLDYYRSDQLRAHFFSLGLGNKNVSFKPKPLDPSAEEKDSDPVMKEGNLLSNVLNRVVRSCFYTTQKYCDNTIPYGEIDKDIIEDANLTILRYEQKMQTHEFHSVMAIVDKYIRNINKYWNKNMQPAVKKGDIDKIKETLINTFHMLRVSTVLIHPIAPTGSDIVVKYLNFDQNFYSWEHIFKDIYHFMADPKDHKIVDLEPKFDFFDKHPSQYN